MNEKGNVIVDDRIPKMKVLNKRRANRKLIVLTVIFFCIVCAVAYTQSNLSKLQSVHWKGSIMISDAELMQISGLESGQFFLNVSLDDIETSLENMAEIEAVEVKRMFPNELSVEIEEHPRVAFWHEEDILYPVLVSGAIIYERPWQNERVIEPILSGWPHREGVVELSEELDLISDAVQIMISEIILTPSESDPYRLTVYMIDGFEVRTSIHRFAQNISWYPFALEEAYAAGFTEGILYLLDGDGGWIEPFPEPEDIEHENANEQTEAEVTELEEGQAAPEENES